MIINHPRRFFRSLRTTHDRLYYLYVKNSQSGASFRVVFCVMDDFGELVEVNSFYRWNKGDYE